MPQLNKNRISEDKWNINDKEGHFAMGTSEKQECREFVQEHLRVEKKQN